jgi:hypothetical protein
MIIINTKSFLKLFGQLLRFIACFLSCPGNIFSLSAPEHSSVKNRNKKSPEKKFSAAEGDEYGQEWKKVWS